MNEWETSKSKPKEEEPKQCEAVGCADMFIPTGPWGQRRCDRCRKEKRHYKEPF